MVTLPRVSVVMPVRNAMPFLDAAVESVLDQTLRDFEFVIGDDASDDGSSERLEYWAQRDPRIRLARRSVASGPVGASNWVVAMARTDILARMDADDVALPTRLAKQLAVLDADPQIVLIGSLWLGIDAGDRTIRPPDYSSALNSRPLRFPFAHGSTMIRKRAFDAAGGYREACAYWEDADLFHRLGGLGRMVVLLEPLYRYRSATTSNRLTSDRATISAQHALLDRCCAAARSDGDYEHLIDGSSGPATPPDKLYLEDLQKRAALQVRAGHRSDAWREWMGIDRARRGPFSFPHFAFLVWSGLAPRSLRWVLGAMVSVRNRSALKQLRGMTMVECLSGGEQRSALQQ